MSVVGGACLVLGFRWALEEGLVEQICQRDQPAHLQTLAAVVAAAPTELDFFATSPGEGVAAAFHPAKENAKNPYHGVDSGWGNPGLREGEAPLPWKAHEHGPEVRGPAQSGSLAGGEGPDHGHEVDSGPPAHYESAGGGGSDHGHEVDSGPPADDESAGGEVVSSPGGGSWTVRRHLDFLMAFPLVRSTGWSRDVGGTCLPGED